MAIRTKAITTRMNFLPAGLIRTLPVAANRVFDPAQEGPPVAARFNARAWGLASPQAVPKPGQGKDNSDQPDHSVLL